MNKSKENGDFCVIDLEFSSNSQTIIEIAVVKYKNYKEIDSFQTYINHGKGYKLSASDKRITHISEESLEGGIPLKEGLCKTIEFIGNNTVYAWGGSDNSVFNKNIQNINYNHKIDISDARILFNNVSGLKHNLSVEDAVMYIGDLFTGTKHNPLDDARNTAKIIIACLTKED